MNIKVTAFTVSEKSININTNKHTPVNFYVVHGDNVGSFQSSSFTFDMQLVCIAISAHDASMGII